MKKLPIQKIKIGIAFLVILAIVCCVITFGVGGESLQSFLKNVHYTNQRCGSSQGVFGFYNVNNADASMVYTNDNIGLIDTGLKETAGVLTQTLSQFQTDTLDFIVISHPHSDHAGGYLEIIKTIKVKRLFIGMYSAAEFKNLSLYNEIIKVSDQIGIEIVYVTHGMNVKIGGISLQFFQATSSSDDENHNSLLVKVTIGNTNCL